jgi:acetylornithine deacetylase/succinyl-diaminopimelate desuccinylase-like protein
VPRDRIDSFLDRHEPEMVRTLSRLVAIPTVNPPGKAYSHCADFLSGMLKEWRIPYEVIPLSAGRYPRFCILGSVGEGRDGLHFHGHYDVVPAYSAAQFDPKVRNSRLYGRGSSDMKSGLVAILYALKYFQESCTKLAGRISFSFVPDEETGSHSGAGYLARTGLFPRPSFGMLMPEPTSGVSFNIVPDTAFFTVDRRFNPEEKLADARKELMQVFDAARSRGIDIETDVIQKSESSLTDPKSPLAVALGKTITEVKGEPPPFELCPGTLEIRFFNSQGIPALAYGPGLLEVSHGQEEYVRIPDMLDCTNV